MADAHAEHVVVVMTDDHGQWCTGAYGNDEVATPTLDHLADTGVRFDNAFCPTPVCSPARASFFTGLRPSQHGIHDYLSGDGDGPDWLAEETTLPELLGEAGYTTALMGKWHCGRGHDARVFDHVENVRPEETGREKFSVERDRRIVDHATDFLREHADEPTFLFVGLTGTHGQWLGEPERLLRRYRGSDFPDVPDDATYPFGRTDILHTGYLAQVDTEEALAQYYAAVEGVDEQVGRLWDELDTLGVREDTFFAYTADHGHCCGHHGMWGKGNGSVPQNLLEESVRVPLIVQWPGEAVTPQVRREFVDHCDGFLTVLEAAGVEPPAAPDFPGRSYHHLVTDAADATDWEQVQIFEYADVDGIRTEDYKLVRQPNHGRELLFDLARDPRETRNVIGDGVATAVDDGYASVAERLRERLDADLEEYGDPAPRRDVDSLPDHGEGEVWTR